MDKLAPEGQSHPLIEKTKAELGKVSADELAKRFLELKSKAHRDRLTGVLNEEGVIDLFNDIVRVLINTEKELEVIHDQPIDVDKSHLIGFRGYGVWLFDLVGLHRTNESKGMGWAVGDRKLKDLANSLGRTFRRSVDSIGRVASDEFIVLSPNARQDKKGSLKMVDKLKKVLPSDVKANVVIGWFEKDINPADAIAQAKEALAQAKRSGPLDEAGRSLGFGVAEVGKYVE